MSEVIKPTPGPWWVDDYGNLRHGVPRDKDTVPVQGVALVGGNKSEPRVRQAYANRDLLFEAGTVFHETQCTPRQLAEQRDQLVERVKDLEEALKAIVDAADTPLAQGGEMWFAEAVAPPIDDARAALSKALPNTVAEVK